MAEMDGECVHSATRADTWVLKILTTKRLGLKKETATDHRVWYEGLT